MTAQEHDLTIGEPSVVGPLAIAPIFGPPASFVYRAFAHAVELGAFAKELESGPTVGGLLIDNATDLPLLAYEGEEVVGAKQNRIFDVTALVPSGARLEMPVTCVERGRWDPRGETRRFRPGLRIADPALRRVKRVATEREGRPDQTEVWQEVDARLSAHQVDSPSASLSDAYAKREDDLASLADAAPHAPGQVGVVACISGQPVGVDVVGRPEVFARLLPALAQGYALQALGAPCRGLDEEAVGIFLAEALSAGRYEVPTPGLGVAFAVSSGPVAGSGLEHEGELVQFSAFPRVAV